MASYIGRRELLAALGGAASNVAACDAGAAIGDSERPAGGGPHPGKADFLLYPRARNARSVVFQFEFEQSSRMGRTGAYSAG